jgi:hypothetical protein
MQGLTRCDRTPPLAPPCPTGCAPGAAVAASCRPWSWRDRGRAFGACCFAGKLRSPAGLTMVSRGRGGLDPTLVPTRRGRVPLGAQAGVSCCSCPSWGQLTARNRSLLAPGGGALRGMIHRRVRVRCGPAVCAACGGNLKPALVATHGGADLGRLLTGQPGSRSCRSAKAAGSNQGRREAILPKAPEGQGRAAAAVCAVAVPGEAGWVGQEVVDCCRPRCRRAPQTARFCWS